MYADGVPPTHGRHVRDGVGAIGEVKDLVGGLGWPSHLHVELLAVDRHAVAANVSRLNREGGRLAQGGYSEPVADSRASRPVHEAAGDAHVERVVCDRHAIQRHLQVTVANVLRHVACVIRAVQLETSWSEQ